MSRSSAAWLLIVASHILFSLAHAGAQNNLPAASPGSASPVAVELRELRVIIEQQTKQIEMLGQQISKLNLAVEARKEGAPRIEQALPAATESPSPAVAEASKPPAAEALNKHVVGKGETLTSIAKHFNISVAELQKVNKIENERKLQIGQSLVIPSPKSPEQQPEKKENP